MALMVEKTKPFASIDLASLNEKIYDFIKQRIINADYPPGLKLNVGEIGRDLGVSHTPVKDALFRLAGEDLIEISSRMGTYVKNITEEDIHEIIQTRIILETAAIEAAAARMTDEDLRQLEELHRQGSALTVDPNNHETYKAFMEYDSRFHLLIFQVAGNRRLMKIYRNLNAHMQFVRFRLMNNAGGRLPTTEEEHQMILEALRVRDPDRARRAIRDHLLRIDAACRAHPRQS